MRAAASCALLLLLAWVGFAGAAASAPAATPPVARTLQVGIQVAPPFVLAEGDHYRGLAVELWEEAARANGWRFRYRAYDLPGLLAAVERGEVDVGVGAITTTAQREQRLDFSHPITSSGLAIAVRSDWAAGWTAVLRALFSLAFLKIVGVLALVLCAVGLAIWLLERRHNPDQFGGPPASGVFSGMWWAMVTMTTVGYGDLAPRTWAGRLLGGVWMLAALVIVSFFTAAITSALMLGQLTSRITEPGDLAGLRIGSVASSTSAAWLEAEHLDRIEAASLRGALRKLADGKLDVVVYDAPLLRWTLRQDIAGRLRVLPITLERQDYAFALPQGSPLREPLDRALLRRIMAPDWKSRTAQYLGD